MRNEEKNSEAKSWVLKSQTLTTTMKTIIIPKDKIDES